MGVWCLALALICVSLITNRGFRVARGKASAATQEMGVHPLGWEGPLRRDGSPLRLLQAEYSLPGESTGRGEAGGLSFTGLQKSQDTLRRLRSSRAFCA